MARTARVDGHTLVQRSVNPIPIAYRTIRRMKSRCPRPSRATITPTATAGGPRICVVGGGVIGLTTALRVYETLPTASVTIAAEKIATDTTSEGAAGLWKPYAISGTDPALVNRWGKETFDHYMSIYFSPEAPAAGVLYTSAYEMYRHPTPDPEWKDVVPSFRHLTEKELAALDPTGQHTCGIAYDTIIAEGRLYMGWLLQRLERHGAVVERRRVERLSTDSADLAAYDAVVNCAGLGARELAADASMQAIRGHVLRVKAPWVRHHVESMGEDSTLPAYIIPNTDTVVLGGTKKVGDEDLTPRPVDREAILARCVAVVPSLAAAEVVGEWVGLRPGRPSVRLELDRLPGGEGGVPLVHNYGHGGSGLTLAWGCAGDAVQLLAKALE